MCFYTTEIKPFDEISPSIKIVHNLLNFDLKNVVIKKNQFFTKMIINNYYDDRLQ